ncbi:MAG: riboflavin synthase [Candidatus Azotimanducaceae bacterium]|jgi:riboflavin synthase
MFTGIIEAKEKIQKSAVRENVMSLTIGKPSGWELKEGQSIAVNGACLTVVSFDEQGFDVELVSETLEKTIFGSSMPELVNLERAMLSTDRFEGHIVQGHIEGIGTVTDIQTDEHTMDLTVSFDSLYQQLLVEKGSVTVNGVSLTICALTENTFSLALIPHTIANTTLGFCAVGDIVNLEFDIIGKYLTKNIN